MQKKRRKYVHCVLCVWGLWMLCAGVVSAGAQVNESGTSAKAAVVIDAATGRVLMQYNATQRLAQASTTKIMTTLLALEEPDVDTYFTVDTSAIHVEGSSMGLQDGDQASLRQLCFGMILPSGNDAANAVAVKLAGDIPSFAKLMNARAFQLGLDNTAFVTPSGLDAQGHYTTALELAALARYAMSRADFREIAAQYTAKTKFGNPPFERWLKNHNKLLEFYEPCIGIKTGFTDNAKRVLVSAAAQDGMELICVTMDDPDDWADHQRLYEQLFAELTPTDVSTLLPPVTVPVAGGKASVLARAPEETYMALREGEYERLSTRWCMEPFAYAPVAPGDCAGEVSLLLEGETVVTFPLCYRNGSAARTPYQEGFSFSRLLKQLFS